MVAKERVGGVRSKVTRTDSAAENVKHVCINHGGTQAGRERKHKLVGREKC